MMENVDDIHTIEDAAAGDNPTISDAASCRLIALQGPTASDKIAAEARSTSSYTDGSFWTAPSETLDSPVNHMISLDVSD